MIFSGYLQSAAVGVGLLLCALVAGSLIARFFFGRVSIDFLPPSTESYFHTPDIAGNRRVTDDRSRQFSYTMFRLKLRLSTSTKIQIKGSTVYAFHKDMPRQWAELSAVTLPVFSDDEQIHDSIQDFVKSNLQSQLDPSVLLDNGAEKYNIQLNAGEIREMVFARLGGFTLTLPRRSRKIHGADYCDMLLRLDINAAAVVFLCSVPAFNDQNETGPIVMASKTFRNAKTFDILTWALGARPNAGGEGHRHSKKIWVELRR